MKQHKATRNSDKIIYTINCLEEQASCCMLIPDEEFRVPAPAEKVKTNTV